MQLILSTCKVDIVLLQLHTSYQVELLYYKVHYFRFPIKHNPCARTLEIPQSMAETFTTLIWMITHYIDSLVNQNNHHNTSKNTKPYWQEYHKEPINFPPHLTDTKIPTSCNYMMDSKYPTLHITVHWQSNTSWILL